MTFLSLDTASISIIIISSIIMVFFMFFLLASIYGESKLFIAL